MARSIFFLLALTALVLTSCTVTQAPQALLMNEDDLRRDVSIEEIEGLLGEPYYRFTRFEWKGYLEIRRYISVDSKKSYTVSFWNGRLKSIDWSEGKKNLEGASSALNATFGYGQLSEEVRGFCGTPDYVVLNESKRMEQWWYSLSEDTAYMIAFEDGRLVGVTSAPGYDIRDYLEIYKKFVLNTN
jgi:hypothetical protein